MAEKANRLIALSVFLTTLGFMLATIEAYAISAPFFDEWEAEAAYLYRLFETGNLNFLSLFEAHNGHRIPITRAISVGLYILNDGWDPVLQMIVSAVLHATVAFVLATSSLRYFSSREKYAALAAVLILYGIPFSWLSITVAFQTQFYSMMMFSVLSISAFTSAKTLRASIFALLATLSMTSGALVFASFVAIKLLESWRLREFDRRTVCHLVAWNCVFWAFYMLIPSEPASESLKAQSIISFLISMAATVSWPFRLGLGVGLILYLPVILCITMVVISRCKLSVELLGFGIFVLLQIVAMSFFRGADGVPPANRYWEILIFGVWVNTSCLLFIANLNRRTVTNCLAILWIVVVASGLFSLAHTALTQGLPDRAITGETSIELIREYLETGNQEVFQNRSSFEISHPDAAALMEILSDPIVLDILPSQLNGSSSDRLLLVKEMILSLGWVFVALGFILSIIVIKKERLMLRKESI